MVRALPVVGVRDAVVVEWASRRRRVTTGGYRTSDAAARARTWDNLGNNQVLYQLSYGGSITR